MKEHLCKYILLKIFHDNNISIYAINIINYNNLLFIFICYYYRNIFINRSDKHLIKVFDKYQKNYKNSMVKAVKGEFSGEIKKSLIAHSKYSIKRFSILK